MPKTLIENVEELSPYKRRLNALGYRTLGQFVGAAFAAGDDLKAYLNTDINVLLAALPARHAPLLNAARLHVAKRRRFPLGARLGRTPTPARAFAISPPAAAALPTTVNLVSQMPPIKDQGTIRGTCVAFASLAVVEQYAGLQGAYNDLSEQFLYWDCKANDGDPNGEGTWLSISFPELQQDGSCLEATWPYNSNAIPGNEGQGPPPAGAQAEALGYKVGTINPLAPTSLQNLKSELARGHCVAFTIPVFDSWYDSNEVMLTGDITLPIPNEAADGGHALCIVGYVDDSSNAVFEGGSFIIRNSWGTDWVAQCQYGAGYGTIPYAYIASYADEAYSVY